MKIWNVKQLVRIALGVFVIVAVACDKKSSGSNPAPVTSHYNYVNNACYDITTNVPVALSSCALVVINGNYRWDGAVCRDLAGNQAPSITSCYVNGVLPGSGVANGTGQYRMLGTQCVDINNQPVSQTLCTQVGNGRYQIVNGTCVDTVSWVQAHYSQCNGVTGYNANACNGTYYKLKSIGGGLIMTWYTVQCYTKGDGTNSCARDTVIDPVTGTQKVCP